MADGLKIGAVPALYPLKASSPASYRLSSTPPPSTHTSQPTPQPPPPPRHPLQAATRPLTRVPPSHFKPILTPLSHPPPPSLPLALGER